MEAHGGGGWVEAGAVAGGAHDEFGVFHALDGAVGIEFGFEHGVEAGGVEMVAAFGDAAVAAALRAPAVGRVEGEQPGVEIFEGLVAGGAVRLGGKEDELIAGGEEFDQPFADGEGVFDRGLEIQDGGFFGRGLAVENRHHDIDVVFLEAFEAGEVCGVLELSVHEQAGEALFEGPFGDLGVVAFFAADERG